MAQRILICDDYKKYVGLLEKTLANEGFETLACFDGEAALKIAKTEKPDLILLDIMMPVIGGPEVRVELLKDPSTKDIPVIFLTGLRAPVSSKKHSSLDGVKVVGKSGEFGELLAAIRETLGKPSER